MLATNRKFLVVATDLGMPALDVNHGIVVNRPSAFRVWTFLAFSDNFFQTWTTETFVTQRVLHWILHNQPTNTTSEVFIPFPNKKFRIHLNQMRKQIKEGVTKKKRGIRN
jgi:hypothetical protein